MLSNPVVPRPQLPVLSGPVVPVLLSLVVPEVFPLLSVASMMATTILRVWAVNTNLPEAAVSTAAPPEKAPESTPAAEPPKLFAHAVMTIEAPSV